MKTLYKVSTFLILALGVLHITLTPLLFHSLTPGALWFVSGGLVIIFLSFFNFILMSDGGKHRVVQMLTHTANLTGLLQHYNVLVDSERGWLAIDPKGVIGEVEYEVGATLRNPIERPELFASRATIERRIRQFTEKLNLDYERVLAWGFVQAVLSAIWDLEDGFAVDAMNPALRLATAIQPMLAG